MSNIKVFSAGMPPDSMWLEPVGTWTDIITGRRSAEGLFIRAEDALRFAAPAPEWCGSEGGTARRLEDDSGQPIFAADDESDFERRDRIADVKADKQRDADR